MKHYLLTFTLILLSISSCVKVGNFDSKGSLELYAGPLTIISREEDIGTQTGNGFVSYVTDGETVTFYGLTGITPTMSLGNSSVSGVTGRKDDNNTVKLDNFIFKDNNAEKFKASIRGSIKREGIYLYSVDRDPITISRVDPETGKSKDVIEIRFYGTLLTYL